MINITNEKQCCGCFACKQICPKNCIDVVNGSLGHLFPRVNNDLCCKCGLCETVCPLLNNRSTNEFIEAYCAFSTDNGILHKSSSGGMFYSIAKYFLLRGFVVFGSTFDSSLKLSFKKVDSISDLDVLLKSKYLQSSSINCFSEIKRELNTGKKILFCGTPCQVAGLKNFLKQDNKNLFTIDFFCHGVPSQLYFDKCLDYVQKKKKIKILSYEFRSKIKNSKTPHYFTIKYINKNNKTMLKTDYYFNSPFYATFQKYINLRESCYNCEFCSKKRYSDITIGDFHNVNKYFTDIDRFKGVSMLIFNSERSLLLKQEFKESMKMFNIDLNTLICNKEILQPTIRPKNRDEFMADFSEMDFDKFVKKYVGKHLYFKERIYYRLPNWLRVLIKEQFKI